MRVGIYRRPWLKGAIAIEPILAEAPKGDV